MTILASSATCLLNDLADEPPSADVTVQVSETEIVRRFSTQVMSVAQRQLSRYLRHKVEPEDISQSVFRSFFRRHRLGEFEFRDWNGVGGLLVRLVVCKCRNRMAFLFAQRRDVRVERSLDSQAQQDDVDHFEPWDGHPAPDDEAAMTETLDAFLSELSADDQAILAAHLAGFRSPKISAQIGSSEQTVRRRLQQMEQKLRKHLWQSGEVSLEAV